MINCFENNKLIEKNETNEILIKIIINIMNFIKNMELDYQGIDPYGTFRIYNLKDRINQIVYRITLGDTNKIEEFQKTVYKRLFKNGIPAHLR